MKEATVILAHENHVMDVLFTSDSKTLLSAGMDNTIKLWSVPSWQEI
ncbi:MAG TPA: hypothetical protein G4O14_06845, partial [Anaerolineae bacterium]|nr:hypothetical protein [Anaerolineae bacterium]